MFDFSFNCENWEANKMFISLARLSLTRLMHWIWGEESDWRIQWLCWVWLVFNDYAESTWQILWISWVWLVVFNEYAGSDSALMNTIGPNRCTTKSLRRKPNQKKCIQESTSESGWNSFQEKFICLSMNLYLLSV